MKSAVLPLEVIIKVNINSRKDGLLKCIDVIIAQQVHVHQLIHSLANTNESQEECFLFHFFKDRTYGKGLTLSGKIVQARKE